MSLRARLRRLERRHLSEWEAPFIVIDSEDDARRARALRMRYAAEIERDRARGRRIFGVDFRHDPT